MRDDLTCKLEAAKKLLSQTQRALMDGNDDKFFPNVFKALYDTQQNLVKGSLFTKKKHFSA